MNKTFLFVSMAVLTSSVSANTNTSELDKFNSTKSVVSFTENKGQISDQNYNPRPDVLFSGVANGLTFHIRKDGISYQTSRVDSWKEQDENLPEGMVEEGKIDSVPDQMTIYRTDINWLGFNKDYTIESGEAKAGFNNYYLPSCPEGAMNVKSYTDVTFKNLYAGVDVKWYEKNGELEYDFIVAPNTDYTKIAWEIQGAEKISIGENGQLIIKTPLGEIEEQAPVAFQGETQVEAAWKIDGNKISFQLGSYNENESLTIDPVVRLWGTYYSGSGREFGQSCATDANGNVYLAGYTRGSYAGIATAGAHLTSINNNYFGFLVKFNTSGERQWGTYYGGSDTDYGYSCATDTSGNVYLAGLTGSATGIATAGAHQTTYGGLSDAFLVKFNSSGVRQWGTYYGGTGSDEGYSCATDASGNVYLAGRTSSTTGIATTGAHQTTSGGSDDAFLVKFNSSGVRQWGTYYGGSQTELGHSCATDANGNVYLTGYTSSSDGIATAGAHQTTSGGSYDAFLVKFNSSGVRQWGTYYGGTGSDEGYSCATDASGNVYLAGHTSSTTGIATVGSHQNIFGGSDDAFLVKFNSSGVRQWGTYYGGSQTELGHSCATDANGNVYLTGYTSSSDGIATAGAHQTILGGNQDAFLVKFGASGVRQWGTYYGGTQNDFSYSCATDANGNVHIAGTTFSESAIASFGAHQVSCEACSIPHEAAFIVKFDAGCTETYSEDTVTACDSYTWIDGVTYTSNNNTATDTLIASNGCDSIVSLNLTINDTKTSTETVVANDSSYTWIDGVTYTSSNNTATDTLIASNGCDSIVTLNLTLILGLNNLATSSNIKVYPNPTNGKLTIDSKNFEGVEVYDVSGRLINKSELNTIDLEGQSKGLYLLKINANGTTQEFKVLKE
ncbi:SBBP repeat-containing protein [Salibacteraceae bacterium]|nr:SBBP repeat-containing protein [Salibacteraceae bacterium]